MMMFPAQGNAAGMIVQPQFLPAQRLSPQQEQVPYYLTPQQQDQRMMLPQQRMGAEQPNLLVQPQPLGAQQYYTFPEQGQAPPPIQIQHSPQQYYNYPEEGQTQQQRPVLAREIRQALRGV